MGTRRDRSEWLRKRRPRFLTLRTRRGPMSRREVVLLASVAFVFVAAVSICVVILHRQKDTPLAIAELLPPGDVRLPAKQFQDGQAHFYRYITAGGREVRFFVIESPDGVVRAAFDSCELCFRQRRGYRQEGSAIVCNSCRRTFPSSGIGIVKGDCNPSPFERVIEGDQVLLKASTLELGAAYF